MFYIVLFLTAGFLVGYKLNLSDKIIKINGRIQTISLFALIFVMGMGIGSDKEVLKSIPAKTPITSAITMHMLIFYSPFLRSIIKENR